MSSEQQWTPRVRRVSGGDRERMQYVVSLMREQRFDEARDELLATLQEDDRSIPAHMMLGSLYLRQRMHADALDEFKHAIEIDPMHIQAHIRAGTCCLRLKDTDQAKALLQTALDLDPKQTAAHFAMAQAQAQSDETAQAISHLQEALRLDPQMRPARLLLARLLSKSGKTGGAIEELTSLVNTDPDNAGATVQLAMLQARGGNTKKALDLLEKAAKANPDAARVQDLLGRMKMTSKDYAGAEKAFTRSMELNSKDRAAPVRLAEALIKQNKLDQARDLLKNVRRVGRLTGLVHQYYGDIYAAKKLYDDAVQSYTAAILSDPDGESAIAEIEAAAGPGADSKAKVPHFQAAFAERREKAREQSRSSDQEERGARRRQRGQGLGAARSRRPAAGRARRA